MQSIGALLPADLVPPDEASPPEDLIVAFVEPLDDSVPTIDVAPPVEVAPPRTASAPPPVPSPIWYSPKASWQEGKVGATLQNAAHRAIQPRGRWF